MSSNNSSSGNKVRVYELARDLGIDDSKPIMNILRGMGYPVKTASNSIPDEAVEKVREAVGPHIEQIRKEAKAKKSGKETVEPPAPVQPKRTIRIAKRATDEEKQALLERQNRKTEEETPAPKAAPQAAPAEVKAPEVSKPEVAEEPAKAPQAPEVKAKEEPKEELKEEPKEELKEKAPVEEKPKVVSEEKEQPKAAVSETASHDNKEQSKVRKSGKKVEEADEDNDKDEVVLPDISANEFGVADENTPVVLTHISPEEAFSTPVVPNLSEINPKRRKEKHKFELPPRVGTKVPSAPQPKTGVPSGNQTQPTPQNQQRPNQQTGKAPIQGARPGQQGARPGQQGNRPGQQGNRPGYQGNRPGQQGNRPGYQGNRPGQQGNRPGYQGNRPGYQGNRPGQQNAPQKNKGRRPQGHVAPQEPQVKTIEIPEVISLAELANRISKSPNELIKYLISQGKMVTINQALPYEEACELAKVFGFEVGEMADENIPLELIEDEDESLLEKRPPVVTVLGHVDHGKTSLLDAIRNSSVTKGEAGGITQKIGAYTVNHEGSIITFIDTPGHEAFTHMRARGASITDIAILVVAADDGVMPQTIEAINHAKAANVPILVAINKIDLNDSDPERVMRQLTEFGLVSEEWGGDTIMVKVSAKKHEGLKDLLEMVLLVAGVKELKANPKRFAQGTIIEGSLDRGMGPVATVLVQTGTLHQNDTVVVGKTWGRLRKLINEKGDEIKFAGPSMPAEIIGLSDVPNAGDYLQAVADEKVAKLVSAARTAKDRHARITSGTKQTLESLFNDMQKGVAKDLNLLVKADGHGSMEALNQSLNRLTTDEVAVKIIHSGVGTISESDVMLASASGATIIGFNVRPDAAVKRVAFQEQVEIRCYRIIYHVIEDIREAMSGLLTPEIEEVDVGKVEVRQIFKTSKGGKICGCYVSEGKVTRDSLVHLIRDGKVIHEGTIDTLRRFKDDVREVAMGYECGLTLTNYQDIQEKDVINIYKKVEHKREL